MDYKNDILRRMRLIYFLMALLALMIIGKVLYIQLVQGDYWREKARTATMRYVNIDAVRGDIYADDGRLLATSIPIYEIRWDLCRDVVSDEHFHAGIDSLAFHLSHLFGDRSSAQYSATLKRARQNQERYHLVKRNVTYSELRALRQFPIFRMGRFRGGLIVVEQTRREMPYKSLAARTIGYEREGVYVGLEGAYRDYLEGVQGKRLMQRISGGSWMPVNDQHEIKPQNGMDLVTTINVQIQDITEKALRRQLNRYNADYGTAIVMEVSTGKIKAISNLMRSNDGLRYEESYNFAVGQSTEPGSTFKLPVLMVALEDGFVVPQDSVDTGEGRTRYYDRIMRDVNEEGHGKVTVEEAFALSSNVGISRIIYEAYKEQPQRFVDGLKRMRLHEPLDIEISGEGSPFIREANSPGWSGTSLPWIAIGYEVSLTPLQMLAFYNTVANNGRMMKPMFVSEVRQSGRVIERFNPSVVDRAIASSGTINQAQELLLSAVEYGTARNIRTEAYPIAGKTGTAQVANARLGYRTAHGVSYQASFAGYFPADDPIYSCIVVIHNPRGYVFHGSTVAAPAFREIADKIHAARMFIPEPKHQESILASLPPFRSAHIADMAEVYAAFNAHIPEKPAGLFAASRLNADTVFFAEREFIENLVPNVVGMGLSDAIFIMENAGLRVRFTGRGIVRSQNIRPGTRIREGSIVYLELS